jgi:hypothetical protein
MFKMLDNFSPFQRMKREERLAEIKQMMNRIEPISFHQSSTDNPIYVDHFCAFKGVDPAISFTNYNATLTYLDLRNKQNSKSAHNL